MYGVVAAPFRLCYRKPRQSVSIFAFFCGYSVFASWREILYLVRKAGENFVKRQIEARKQWASVMVSGTQYYCRVIGGFFSSINFDSFSGWADLPPSARASPQITSPSPPPP